MLPKSLLDISEKAPISHITEIPADDKTVHIKIGKNLSITQDGILSAADVVVPNAAETDILQSLEGDRTEIIPAYTNYTVPEYIVGINSLQVYINGARAACGLDSNKHAYKEIGVENQPSTTIQFLDPIPVDAEIIIEVNRTLTQAVINKLGDNILPSIENKTDHYFHTDGTSAAWETLSDKFLSISGGTITGNIIPNADETIDLGSATNRFKTLYVKEARLDVNTLWIGDTPVLGTSTDTIVVKADEGQSLQVKTSGVGSTQIISDSIVQISAIGSAADIKMIASGQGAKASITASTQTDINSPNINLIGSVSATGGVQVDSLTVTGNMTIKGTTTVVNSNTLQVKDNIIEINKGETGTGVTAGQAGVQINRGAAADYLLVFDETEDMFKVGTVNNLETLATREFINTLEAADISAVPSSHVAVAATEFTLGHVKINTGFVNDNGTISVAYGTEANTACVGNDERLNNARIPVAHASTATTYGVSSSTKYGHSMASSAVPLVAGTATAGLDNGKFAREGHVHPAQINISGNSETTTKLKTARKINTVAFDGTKDITIYDSTKLPLSGGKLTGPIRFDSTMVLWSDILTSPNGSIIYQNDYTGYTPVINLKTDNGRVGIGTYQSELYFTFFKDTNTTNTADNRMVFTEDQVYITSSITASTFNGSLSGNADTATKLKTARTINDTLFDGTENIVISANRTRQQSLRNERSATINANTNYTVPEYVVGKNQLDVYINGLYCSCGTDSNKHTYKEIGTNGTSSTTIQFFNEINTTHDIVVISYK